MIWDKQLSRDHAYYYQVQSQINICKQASYGDFVWSESNIYIERILLDKVFWNGLVEKATIFFKTCLLSELVGKFHCRSICPLPNSLLQGIDDQESSAGNSTTINPCDEGTSAIDRENNKNSVEKWCYCQGVGEEGRPIIYCDK